MARPARARRGSRRSTRPSQGIRRCQLPERPEARTTTSDRKALRGKESECHRPQQLGREGKEKR
eukprot:11858210-Alexandrium_andersonii.AAC.1